MTMESERKYPTKGPQSSISVVENPVLQQQNLRNASELPDDQSHVSREQSVASVMSASTRTARLSPQSVGVKNTQATRVSATRAMFGRVILYPLLLVVRLLV
jgi:hypothetical protein